ncbi:MFS transporter, partial [Chloroflexota bacterium]
WGHGYHAYGFSALFKPISSELGFSRAATSVAASIGRLEGGLESLVTGWITDRFGPKWIVFAGVLLIGLSLISMNYINSLWTFYLVWGVMLGTGINIALSVPLYAAITNWFIKKRGLALSIQNVFSGLSGVVVMPLIAWLTIIQGWRSTCVTGGIVMLLVGLPIVWFCIKQRRPEYYGLLPDGATIEEEIIDSDLMVEKGIKYAEQFEEVEFTLRQALKTISFWLLIGSHAVHNLLGPAMSIHCIPFLTDLGIAPLKAAGMMALYVGASIPGRFAGGLIADRVRTGQLRYIMGIAYLLQALGIAAFLVNQTIAMIFVWFIIYGVGMGIGMPISSLMRARYFGRKAFGSIQGFSQMVLTPVGIIAPVYVGWVYDTTGSYISAFTLLAISITIAGIIAFFILPPKAPAQITDIRKIV